MVQIRLLGGVSAATDDGLPIDVGPPKCQAVLAALALSPGSAVPVPRLVELVWGERPPATAAKNVQSYVTRLRKGLGPATMVRAGVAYRLDADAEVVDVARFQRRLDAGDVGAALAEWTATPLAGLEVPGLTATVDGLVERWLGAREVDLRRRIETDAAGVIGTLTELTTSYPFREGLWTLLMTALYRVGRQADALAAYGRARQHLVAELGVEPGPGLRELESSILGHDERLGVERLPDAVATGPPTGTVTFGSCHVDASAWVGATPGRETTSALGRLDALARTLVTERGGHVVAAGGESFGVAFHRARDASAWAAALQAAVSSEPWPAGVDLGVCIGLHAGETDAPEAGYLGAAAQVASRLAAAGHGGQVLVSAVTAALLDGDDLWDLGSFRLVGVAAEQRVLQLDAGRHPPLRTESRRGNLPRPPGRLIGRDKDLDVVASALAASWVVTLVGPGGIGKTRLALAAADRAETDFAGGAWLVELAAIGASQDVPRAVADVLGVKENPARTLTRSIVAVLQSRRVLLVLDNCEHVVDGAAALTHALTENCPDVRVLATSREGLGVGDEQLVAVAPLDPEGPAVELFDERASAASLTWDRHASRADVAEVCRRLDGVPLAIELAGARTRSLSPAELVERLDDRLRLLTGGRRTAAERHRTLRATIQWSYDLFSAPERALFASLSVCTGPFDLAAVETVAGDADVHDVMAALVEQSMVLVDQARPAGASESWRRCASSAQSASPRPGAPTRPPTATRGGASTRSAASTGSCPATARSRASPASASCGRTCGQRSTGHAPAATAGSPTRSSARWSPRSRCGARARSVTGSSGSSPSRHRRTRS